MPRSLRNESSAVRVARVQVGARLMAETVAAKQEGRQLLYLVAREEPRGGSAQVGTPCALRALMLGYDGRGSMRSPRSPNDAKWLACALDDTESVLRDHAHAERKAAATAMGLVAQYADIPELVEAMTTLAIEELEHFREVFATLQRRGLPLGSDPGDPYAQALMAEVRGTRGERLVDRLLVGALIEARSCRRLALLGQHHGDAELAELWRRLARAEAAHGPLFLSLARRLGTSPEAVDARFRELEAVEARLIDEGPVRAAVH